MDAGGPKLLLFAHHKCVSYHRHCPLICAAPSRRLVLFTSVLRLAPAASSAMIMSSTRRAAAFADMLAAQRRDDICSCYVHVPNVLRNRLMYNLRRRDVMTKLADALEGGHSGWRGVPYLRIDGDTDSLERFEVLPSHAVWSLRVTHHLGFRHAPHKLTSAPSRPLLGSLPHVGRCRVREAAVIADRAAVRSGPTYQGCAAVSHCCGDGSRLQCRQPCRVRRAAAGGAKQAPNSILDGA